MARRIGLRTLRDIAYNFCKAYVKFYPGLAIIFATNQALLAALAAVNAACDTLVIEADKAFEPGV